MHNKYQVIDTKFTNPLDWLKSVFAKERWPYLECSYLLWALFIDLQHGTAFSYSKLVERLKRTSSCMYT